MYIGVQVSTLTGSTVFTYCMYIFIYIHTYIRSNIILYYYIYYYYYIDRPIIIIAAKMSSSSCDGLLIALSSVNCSCPISLTSDFVDCNILSVSANTRSCACS